MWCSYPLQLLNNNSNKVAIGCASRTIETTHVHEEVIAYGGPGRRIADCCTKKCMRAYKNRFLPTYGAAEVWKGDSIGPGAGLIDGIVATRAVA